MTATLRKKKGSNRGLSEIVATLLMLVVIISLSVVVFGVATNSFGNFSNSFSNLFSNSSDSLSEQVAVEQITFNETGSNLGANIYLRNVGSNIVTVSAVYVTNITANAFVLSFQVSPTKQLLVSSFQNIAVKFTPNAGSTYSFNVATQRGNTVLANAKA